MKIGGRLGAKSKYTLRDIAVSLVDRYSITHKELCVIVNLPIGVRLEAIDDLVIERVT
jgi:hypothetical protein